MTNPQTPSPNRQEIDALVTGEMLHTAFWERQPQPKEGQRPWPRFHESAAAIQSMWNDIAKDATTRIADALEARSRHDHA